MGPVFVLVVGLVIVIGGVLAFRLPAFVALILAALFVASFTPQGAFEHRSLADQAKKQAISIENPEEGDIVRLSAPNALRARIGDRWQAIRLARDPWHWESLGILIVQSVEPDTSVKDRDLVLARWESAPISALAKSDVVLTTQAVASAKSDAAKITAPNQVAAGFGSTAAGIGMLIAFASIVGKCLLDSGAADRVVRSALRITGEGGAPAAFVGSGFLLGIPVFFDTVFYLMLPLGKALTLRTGRNYLFYVLTIVAGATMAHSLVPPTPGPLLAAAELKVGIGLMMLVGSAVGIGTVIAGYFYAAWLNGRFVLELPVDNTSAQGAAARAETPEADLPPLWLALLPLLLPVVLIGGAEMLAVWKPAGNDAQPLVPPSAMAWLQWLGDKNIALILAAAIAVGTLIWKKHVSRLELARSLQDSLTSAGMIILITSAGGAFGKVMQQTGVASLVGELPLQSTPAILTLAFLITAAVRTAQGSATVAMITAVGILAPLAATGQLPFHPVWLAVAIGCGSKPLAWMNDSGFWVITQMSGMSEAEGLKYVTTMLLVMSVVGLLLTIAGAMLLPLL